MFKNISTAEEIANSMEQIEAEAASLDIVQTVKDNVVTCLKEASCLFAQVGQLKHAEIVNNIIYKLINDKNDAQINEDNEYDDSWEDED